MPVTLYDFSDYKLWIRHWVESQPQQGRGQYRKISLHLRVSPVLVSQIFRGSRDLSLEQALLLTEFLGLSDSQTHYFLVLVQLSRAGSARLRQYYEKQATQLREKSLSLKHRVTPEKRLNPEAAALFYSHWHYSAIRLATSVPGLQSVTKISERLGIQNSRTQKILDRLVDLGLCVFEKGEYRMGPRTTHLPADSPLVGWLHSNWRQLGANKVSEIKRHELFYSSPVSISSADLPKIRAELLAFIERFSDRVKNSGSETLACLNLDWFEI